MVLFPILLLFIAALLIWILRLKHSRIHWFVITFGAFLAWVALYLLADQLPIRLEFSIWQPKALFSSPLILSLDEISWPLVMGISGILIVISLTLPARGVMVSAWERISVLIYTCFSLAAVMAGNILSVAIAWMLMDAFIFALSIYESDPERPNNSFLWWFGKNLVAIVLIVLAAVTNISIEGSTSIYDQVSTTSMVIIIVSSLLRMPFPALSQHAEGIGWIDTGDKSTLDLFPMITGLAVLAKVLNVVNPEEAILWLYLIGCLLVVISLLQLIFFTHEKRSIVFINFGLVGIGILLATYSGNRIGILISAVGVIILSINSWLNFLTIHERWHYVVPILFTAMMAGMVGTPGGVLSHAATQGFLEPGHLGIELLIGIGMGLLGVFYFGFSFIESMKWKSAENLTITSYSLALMLLISNTFLIGLKFNTEFSAAGIIFFLSVSVLTGIILYSMIRLDFQFPIQLNIDLRLPMPSSIFIFVRSIGEGLTNVMSAVARVFEGETGLLWAFVILQLLVLAFGSIG